MFPPEFAPVVTIGVVNGQIAVMRHGGTQHPQAIFMLRVAESLLLQEIVRPAPQDGIVAAPASALQGLK